MSVRNVVATAKAIYADLADQLGPPEEGLAATTQPVINSVARARDTRMHRTRLQPN